MFNEFFDVILGTDTTSYCSTATSNSGKLREKIESEKGKDNPDDTYIGILDIIYNASKSRRS